MTMLPSERFHGAMGRGNSADELAFDVRDTVMSFSEILRATDALFAAIFPRKKKRTLNEAEKQSLVKQAAVYVAHHLGYRHGMGGYNEILDIFTKVYFRGKAGRKEVCAKYGLSEHAYTKRLLRYRDILKERIARK